MPKEVFKVSVVDFSGKKSLYKGSVLTDVLGKLKPVKGKVVVKVSKGKLNSEKFYYPFEFKMLINNKTKRLIEAKKFELRLK